MEKQRRAFNFSAAEIEILISSVEKGKPVLFGKFSPSLSNEDKEREWAKVAENVSAVSGVSRSAESVKKKFTTLVSETKKKAALQAKEVKKTGGGTSDAPSLTPSETRILGVIDKVHYEGIPGGYEVGLEMDQSELSTIQLSDLEEGTSVPLQLPPSKRQKVSTSSHATQLLEIEREKLELYRERVAIEKERLKIEKERLQMERSLCKRCREEL
ncbi:myb/SANT-like DNA-binding domain-containing protein 4 [Megalobrama amblycephala]|uniref:myb/SANT-like DNA-binding domain-containing protein 4 n=1 Tax=Megalobrama amblycephala TaxID=75352 RepID=UPI002013E766|nr:myb/SANT-like DNA-binding domain-containing protein 4 [Megalobrama amblycephala]